jgi:2-polyprenyl-3-methyl-5-hydroxy-6-metoxy-1,4-benzoquinol methylase
MLLFDAARGSLPRWFEEGVASGLERSWGMRDMLVWSSSLLTGRLPVLTDLDAAFESSEGRARAAYAASFDFLTWTVRRYGSGVVRDIVREAAARPFPEAWKAATGAALAQSETEWRRSSVLLYRWVPALTGTGALWAGITVLALAAGARRRARSRAIRERWEAEERWTRTERTDERQETAAEPAGAAPVSAGAAAGSAGTVPGVRSLEFFQEVYEGGTPPWDIGRPQPEVVRLAEQGEIRGSVLDVGCGSGENALHLAALGHEVWGIDGAPLAVERALRKARERGLEATFLVGDALELGGLGRTFDTVIDSGLFHVFSDEDRPLFVRGLAAVVRPGGRYLLICFSEREPGTEGPRRVTQGEIRSAFGHGWRIEGIREARFETNRDSGDARAWLATIARA